MQRNGSGRRREFIKRAAAAAAGLTAMAPAPLRGARLIDGALWTGRDPARFAQAHPIHA
jgi:hypothetical protein